MNRSRVWGVLLLSAAVVLAGCATPSSPGRGGAGEGRAERPWLDTPPRTEAQARAKAHVDLGTAYFEVERYGVALDEARVALAHSPAYPPADHLMALVYMFIDDESAAREHFQRALRAAPEDPDFNNSYGWFLCVTGEAEAGLERLALAARNPYYRHAVRPHINAGLCHLRVERFADARAQFRRALTFERDNAVARYHLAALAYREGEYAEARRELVQLHRQEEPTPESAWLGLRVERQLGNREAAESYAQQLRGRFGDSPEYEAMMRGDFE